MVVLKFRLWTLAGLAALPLSFVGAEEPKDPPPPAKEGSPAEGLLKDLDKNGDGNLTREEVPEERRRFFDRLLREADADKSESLTLDELKGARLPEGPRGAAGGPERRFEPGEMFKRLDKNSDGKVTRDEIPEPLRERMKPLFDRIGKDELTREDLEKMRPPFGGERPDAEAMFKRLDTNGDGKLTLTDVPEDRRERVERMLERAGKEKDGAITLEEFKKGLESMRGPGGEGRRPRRPEGRAPEGKKQDDAESKGEAAKREEDDGDERERRAPEGAPDGEGRPPREGDRGPGPGPRRGPRGEGDRGPRDRGPDGGPGERGDRPRRPNPLAKIDLNGDHRITREELTKLVDRFNELDENGDGELDPHELLGPPPGDEGERRGPPPARGDRDDDRRGPPPRREGEGRRGPPPREGDGDGERRGPPPPRDDE